MAAAYLGIDVGTSGCRVLAIDAAGDVLAQARADLPAPTRHNGASQQAPDIWWRALTHVLRQLSKALRSHQPRALAIDATSATVLLTDAAGQPLTPALMYDDSRSGAEAQRIRRHAPSACAAQSATGSLAKLLYLQAQQPRARHVLHQADWLANRLLGRYGYSDENNCLKLGYDCEARRWPDWLQALDIVQERLPQVSPPGTSWGYIDPIQARALQLPEDLQIVAGTTDSTAAFIATGANEIGDGVTTLGSTLVVKMLAERAIFEPMYGVYSHRLGERWLVGGASNSGGAVLRAYFSKAEIQALSRHLRPAIPTGLDYYPLLRPGERFPISDPGYPPRVQPRPDDELRFFQGLLEGIAKIEQRAYQLLQELGAAPLRTVRSSGGGAINDGWTQIRRRHLRVPLLAARQQEAAYGSALLARQALITEQAK